MADEPRQPFQGSAAHLVVPPEQTAWIFQLETILEEHGEIERMRRARKESGEGGGKPQRNLHSVSAVVEEIVAGEKTAAKRNVSAPRRIEGARGILGGGGGGAAGGTTEVVGLARPGKGVLRKSVKRRKKTDSSQSTNINKDPATASASNQDVGDEEVKEKNASKDEEHDDGVNDGDEDDDEQENDNDDPESSSGLKDSFMDKDRIIGPTIPAVIVTKKVNLIV